MYIVHNDLHFVTNFNYQTSFW